MTQFVAHIEQEQPTQGEVAAVQVNMKEMMNLAKEMKDQAPHNARLGTM